jgi:hypothetical protein
MIWGELPMKLRTKDRQSWEKLKKEGVGLM